MKYKTKTEAEIKAIKRKYSGMCEDTIHRMAENKDTSPEVLDDISYLGKEAVGGNNEWYNDSVSSNPNTSVETLDRISKEVSFLITKEVAKNPKTHPDTLMDMLNLDFNKEAGLDSLIYYVAKHKNTSVEALRLLYNKYGSPENYKNYTIVKKQEASWMARIGLIKNKNTPADVLKSIALTFKENISLHFQYIDSMCDLPNMTLEVFNLLIKNIPHAKREIVAQNINTPTEILRILSGDSYKRVRMSVAQNINTPIDILDNLANDKCREVARASQHTRTKQKQYR